MAANVLTPQGLIWSRQKIGAAPTSQAQVFYIKKGFASTIGVGDLVKTLTSGNQGYIGPSAFNDSTGLGVFVGVLPYFDLTLQATSHGLNGSYVANTNAAADIPCLVISDPFAVFRIQGSGVAFTQAMRGNNANWITGTNGVPNPAGISTLTLDMASPATTATFPFRIEGVAGVPGGPQDPANTNPVLEVSLNFGWSEMTSGTGI